MSFSSITALSNAGFNALSKAEQLLFSALQGLINRDGDEAFYCVCNNFNNLPYTPLTAEMWLQYIPLEKTIIGSAWSLLDKYSRINSYILCDMIQNPASANIATTLAGVLGAVPADRSIAGTLDGRGFTQAIDVTTWTLDTLLNNYQGKLNTRFAVELNNDFATNGAPWGPRDYAVAGNAIVFYGNDERSKVMNLFTGSSPIYGWGPLTNRGEYEFIYQTGGAGNYYVAADAAYNLSVFSQLNETLQPVPPDASASQEVDKTKIYVAFMISDGDNLQWLLNRGDCSNWWGSPIRGTIPLGWTMSPSLMTLAPTVWNYYINTLKPLDEIICGASGIGYVYDNIASSPKFAQFLAQTQNVLALAGLEAVATFGNDPYPNTGYLQGFTNQQAVTGVLYSSYTPWVVPENPKVVVYNNKPVIPTSLNLSGNAQSVVAAIRKASAPVLVYVDAWGNNNNPLQTVQEVCTGLKGYAKIVKPSQLFGLVS